MTTELFILLLKNGNSFTIAGHEVLQDGVYRLVTGTHPMCTDTYFLERLTSTKFVAMNWEMQPNEFARYIAEFTNHEMLLWQPLFSSEERQVISFAKISIKTDEQNFCVWARNRKTKKAEQLTKEGCRFSIAESLRYVASQTLKDTHYLFKLRPAVAVLLCCLLLFLGMQRSAAQPCRQGFSRHKVIYSNSSFQQCCPMLPVYLHKKITTMQPTATQLASLLEKLAYRKSFRDVFTDLLDLSIYHLVFRDDAKLCRNPLPSYNADEQQQLLSAYKLMGELMEGYTDAFGDVFMEHLSYGKNGQFFTPQPICDMMAIITIGDADNDGKTVCDCACGSGRTLLAAAKRCRNMRFYGSDIDLTCVKMAAINLAYNSLQGEIAWMNALSLEHYASFQICVEPVSKLPFIIIRDKGQSEQLTAIHDAIARMPEHQKEQVAQQQLLFS